MKKIRKTVLLLLGAVMLMGALTACGDSSLTFMVRVWCKNPDYWNVNWDLLKNGKKALDRAGIEIPYPQMDVHMRQ